MLRGPKRSHDTTNVIIFARLYLELEVNNFMIMDVRVFSWFRIIFVNKNSLATGDKWNSRVTLNPTADLHNSIQPSDAQGGWYHPPLAFFPCNFFDDSNGETRLIVSVARDGRHILAYVTSSWRCHVTYVMTSYVHDGGQNTLFYHCLLIKISSDVDAIK